MNNIYYYFFYVVAIFSRRINKKDPDYAFTGVAFISACFSANLGSVMLLVVDIKRIKNYPGLLSILLAGAVFTVNYYLIKVKGGRENIIRYYDELYENKKHSPLLIFLIWLYVISSFVLLFYIAYKVRISTKYY